MHDSDEPTDPKCAASRPATGRTVYLPGSDVPASALLDYVQAGESIEDFLADFPSVTAAQVKEFLRLARLSGEPTFPFCLVKSFCE